MSMVGLFCRYLNPCSSDQDIKRSLRFNEIPMASLMKEAKGGDLILIQEDTLFDHYTKMNSQVCHIVKQLLRTKVDY